ncbi:MAG: putative amino acid permease YhdG [Pseudomonadota bacterium]|jgi:APA family basic amino acid/polyamine antiporter
MAGRGLGQLFARKSIEQMHAENQSGELKKSLGAVNLVLLGIGCIIGTGIFVLTGRAAAEFAGPGIMISFVITGVLCALVAICYSELAAAIPVSGSAYSYSYASLGEFVAWIMGVLLLLEYGVAASTVAVGWSGYTTSLLHDLGINLPAALTAAPGVEVTDPVTGAVAIGVMNVPAFVGICAVTALLTLGISESANVNNIVVAIKVTVVVAFIVIGFFYVNPANWSPLIPDQVPAPPPGSDMSVFGQIWTALGNVVTGQSRDSAYGVGGLIAAASTIFFAYIGFEAVSTAGAEAKNPARDMPIGILGSLIICTILYILTCAVLVGIVPYTELNDPAPIAKAVNAIGLPWFAFLVKVGAFAGLSSVMLVLLYGQTRIFYTMARDGLLPSVFAKVNQKTQTPILNTIVVGVIAAGFAGFTSLDFLGDTTNVGTLMAFMLICVTVVYLRFARPNMHRPFKIPTWAITIIAVLGATMCFLLVMSLMSVEQTRNFFIPYLVIGVLFYFVYGMWNSKLAKGEYITGHEANPDLEAKGLTDVEPPFKK